MGKPPIQKLRVDQYLERGISDEQTLLIGRVVVSFSNLEAALDDTIWLFLNLGDDDGKIVTKRLSADAKVQMLRALAPGRITDGDLLANFNETLKLIDEFKDGRNFIAHGVWATLMPDDIPIAASLKPKGEPGEVVSESFKRERMEGILGGIQAMLQRLINLPEKLGEKRRVPRQAPFVPDAEG